MKHWLVLITNRDKLAILHESCNMDKLDILVTKAESISPDASALQEANMLSSRTSALLASCALSLLLPASLDPSPSSWSLANRSLAWLYTAVRERRWRRKSTSPFWGTQASLSELVSRS